MDAWDLYSCWDVFLRSWIQSWNSGALMHGSNFVRSGEIGKIFKNLLKINKVHYDSNFWARCWKSAADIFQLFGFHGNWSCDKI
jgi:hypothetical protein